MTPKFKTKAGWLTPYALACGYIELHEANKNKDNEVITRLWHEGGTVYHVAQFGHGSKNFGRVFWDCFERLTDARKRFKEATR